MNSRIHGFLWMALLLVSLVLVGCGGGGDEVGVDIAPEGGSQVDGLALTESPDLGETWVEGAELEAGLAYVEEDTRQASLRGSRTLSVEFAPQVPPGDWKRTMSCGPAALNMATAYLHGARIRQAEYIRKINQYLRKRDIDNCLPGGTTVDDLVRAAQAVNGCRGTFRTKSWNLDRLRERINWGQPVVVAVWAGYLPNRGYGWNGGHFVLVVGYDANNIICHDPGTSRGNYKYYSNTAFAKAMGAYGGACVVPQR